MIPGSSQNNASARSRTESNRLVTLICIAPAVIVIVVLFGGGLYLGLIQSLGYLPSAGLSSLSLQHFINILLDPDFAKSLGLTFYIALISTIIAGVFSLFLSLILANLSSTNRVVNFIFQIPLTVPHLVVAVAVLFLISPAGFLSRAAQYLGIINSSSQFPLMVNDQWGFGIIITYVWKEIPFITLMIVSVLHNMGNELVEVGKTLNANRWQRFRYIVLPTIFPSLGAASLIVFAYTFGAFEVPFLLGRTYPMPLPVWAYKNYSDVDLLARPEGIATGIIIAIVVVFSVVLSHRLTLLARRRGVVI